MGWACGGSGRCIGTLRLAYKVCCPGFLDSNHSQLFFLPFDITSLCVDVYREMSWAEGRRFSCFNLLEGAMRHVIAPSLRNTFVLVCSSLPRDVFLILSV
jgi:hypothetical protein